MPKPTKLPQGMPTPQQVIETIYNIVVRPQGRRARIEAANDLRGLEHLAHEVEAGIPRVRWIHGLSFPVSRALAAAR